MDRLPYDVLQTVFLNLGPLDVEAVSATCAAFEETLTEDVCCHIMQSWWPLRHSSLSRYVVSWRNETRRGAREFVRLARRRSERMLLSSPMDKMVHLIANADPAVLVYLDYNSHIVLSGRFVSRVDLAPLAVVRAVSIETRTSLVHKLASYYSEKYSDLENLLRIHLRHNVMEWHAPPGRSVEDDLFDNGAHSSDAAWAVARYLLSLNADASTKYTCPFQKRIILDTFERQTAGWIDFRIYAAMVWFDIGDITFSYMSEANATPVLLFVLKRDVLPSLRMGAKLRLTSTNPS